MRSVFIIIFVLAGALAQILPAKAQNVEAQRAYQEWQALTFAIEADKKCDLMDDMHDAVAMARYSELFQKLSGAVDLPPDPMAAAAGIVAPKSCDSLKQDGTINSGVNYAAFQVQFSALVWVKYSEVDYFQNFVNCEYDVTFENYYKVKPKLAATSNKLKAHANYSQWEKQAEAYAETLDHACKGVSYIAFQNLPIGVYYRKLIEVN